MRDAYRNRRAQVATIMTAASVHTVGTTSGMVASFAA